MNEKYRYKQIQVNGNRKLDEHFQKWTGYKSGETHGQKDTADGYLILDIFIIFPYLKLTISNCEVAKYLYNKEMKILFKSGFIQYKLE